ncbi:Transcription factor 7-like 1-B HMG box transcription factor 3-B [Takifugu flavidus]|uniref:Transcription factor 7-like 1-B HMG box transcription factor 3-B n=1 Tax=Takifugu flavidus TaxID=433684 RepID=A0A5C6NDC7_9TELE|nr:Transcription factor 7-like 1-B HMG box transcription factor 3-B [Takifugu flavidus]
MDLATVDGDAFLNLLDEILDDTRDDDNTRKSNNEDLQIFSTLLDKGTFDPTVLEEPPGLTLDQEAPSNSSNLLNQNTDHQAPPPIHEAIKEQLDGDYLVLTLPTGVHTKVPLIGYLREKKKRQPESEDDKPYIKKPPNAFMLFMKEKRPTVARELWKQGSGVVNQILGKMWGSLSDQEKQFILRRLKGVKRFTNWRTLVGLPKTTIQIITKSGRGSQFRSGTTISHLLYMDDIKLYAKNEPARRRSLREYHGRISPCMALNTRAIEARVHHTRQDPRCRLCGDAPETVQHMTEECKMLAGKIQTDKMVVVNQPDIVMIDKHQKTVVVIDEAIPSDSNIRKKEHEKLENYQGLKEEIVRMWGSKKKKGTKKSTKKHRKVYPTAQERFKCSFYLSLRQEKKKRQQVAKDDKPYIKKPPNAFMLFMKEKRPTVAPELWKQGSGVVNQVLGKMWGTLSDKEKAVYFEEAERCKKLHQLENPGWTTKDNYLKKLASFATSAKLHKFWQSDPAPWFQYL